MSVGSTFAMRFDFARSRQRVMGTWQEDQALAAELGVAPSRIAEYKSRDEAPSAARTLAIAKVCEVDPGWLAFGDECAAPAPEGFQAWLANRLRKPGSQESAATGAVKRGAKQGRGTPAVKSTDVRKRA